MEAVSHGETGLLADEKDYKQLALYIEELLTDNSLWKRYSQNGRERVNELFNLKKQTKKLESIYEEVVNNDK